MTSVYVENPQPLQTFWLALKRNHEEDRPTSKGRVLSGDRASAKDRASEAAYLIDHLRINQEQVSRTGDELLFAWAVAYAQRLQLRN